MAREPFIFVDVREGGARPCHRPSFQPPFKLSAVREGEGALDVAQAVFPFPIVLFGAGSREGRDGALTVKAGVLPSGKVL